MPASDRGLDGALSDDGLYCDDIGYKRSNTPYDTLGPSGHAAPGMGDI